MSKKLKKMKWKTTSLMNFYVQLLERLCQIRLLQQVCRVFLVCLLYYCANAPHIVLQLYYILLYYTVIQYLCATRDVGSSVTLVQLLEWV